MKRSVLFWALAGILLLTACGNSHEDHQDQYSAVTEESDSTETFSYEDLRIEVTNVCNTRIESYMDDNWGDYDCTIFTCYPGAKATVLEADIHSGSNHENGQTDAKWGFIKAPNEEIVSITQDMISEDMEVSDVSGVRAVSHLESGLYLLVFEMADDPAAADEDLLDVAAAMRTVSADDFLNPDDYGNVSAQQLAAALNEAANHQVDPSEAAPDGFFNEEWSIWNIYLEDGSDTWQYDDLRLSVSCGLNENIVEAALCKGGKRDTAYFEVETLYQLVRHSRDYEEIIDETAYKRFESILKTEMEETFEAMSESGNFTGYQLTRFFQEWEFEDPDGCMIEVYDFRFALLTDEPENVSWAGGMYLDGDLRVQGFVRGGRFVVRYHGEEIAATAFMGSDFYYHPGDPDEDRAKEEIISALSYKADSEKGD